MHTEIKSDFFKNGFLSNLFEWDYETTYSFEKETDKYLLSKLACMEIWGRLFVNKEEKSAVTDYVCSNMTINYK
jgi:hypothetical protein